MSMRGHYGEYKTLATIQEVASSCIFKKASFVYNNKFSHGYFQFIGTEAWGYLGSGHPQGQMVTLFMCIV